ncbi:MAG: VWA domain-containing protein [Victivallaceae bacterium]|nr:VWA domain-containing protein [Victivallaceae bacterium]
MRFINVWVLAVLPLILAFVLIMAVTAVSRRRAALRTLYGKAGYADKVCLSRFRRQVRYLVLFVLVAVLALAAARPWWGEIRSDVAGRGSDVVFLLDVSKSMLAEDASPSRLAHAKYLIRQIVKDNPDDRFALVLFSGDALLACPLTGDAESFDMAVDEASPDSIPVGGTNVQRALQLVVEAFSGAETPSRAVVMITDGEQLDGNATSVLAQMESSKIPLFVLGVGSSTEPATIPLRDNSGGVYTMLDRNGNVVRTKLDEALLKNLASGANGRYFHAGNVVTNLDALNRELAKVGTSAYTDNNKPQPIERFMPFMVLAAILLTGFLMISERPRRLLTVLLIVAALAAGAADANSPSAASPAVATGVDPAIHTPAVSASEAKLENWELYQRARSEQVEGEADKAREDYESALQSDGERHELVSSYAYHNLGVLEHGKSRGELKDARTKLRAQDPDAALKVVEDSLHNMDSAEEFYLNALRNGSVAGADTASAQQLLLLDRAEAQTLKKEIEELKKRQEQAKKDAQQAQQQNRRQQDQQDQKDQQQQDQQKQQGQQDQQQQQDQQKQQGQQDQQQQQDQQGQQQKDQQGQQQQKDQQGQQDQEQKERDRQQSEAARQAAEKAGQSSEALSKQAEKLGQDDLKDRAERAKEELNKARSEQEQGNYDQAGKNLQNALDELNASSEKPDEQQKDDQKKQQDKSGDEDKKNQEQDRKEQSGDKSKPESDSKSNAAKDQSQQKIDSDMADAMLKMLSRDERDTRKQLERRRRGGAPQTVEKDW